MAEADGVGFYRIVIPPVYRIFIPGSARRW
jgi:hypothetical protein